MICGEHSGPVLGLQLPGMTNYVDQINAPPEGPKIDPKLMFAFLTEMWYNNHSRNLEKRILGTEAL